MIVGGLEQAAVISCVLLMLFFGYICGLKAGIVGFCVGLIIGGFFATIFFGVLFLFIEMNRNILKIRELLEKTNN